jgi:DNA polymerase I-like protein with 3'-5' exonuclease and polymerase domains
MSQFSFDLPTPKIKIRTPPHDYAPVNDYPELTGPVAIDLETFDPGIQNKTGSARAIPDEGFVCGVAIAWSGGAFYVGIQHAGGNSDADKFWSWLRHQLKKPDVLFIGCNSIYDLGFLVRHGIEVNAAPVDVQGAAALLDEKRSSYSLDSLAWTYLNKRKTGNELEARARDIGVFNAISNMHRLGTWTVAPYAIDDAVMTLELYHKLLPLLQEQDLMRVFELERECLLVGRDLRMRGVRVDVEQALRLKADLIVRRDAAAKRILDATGVAVDPDDNASIARALMAENSKLELPRTATGKLSVAKAAVEGLQTPVSTAITELKKMQKTVATFIEGYIEKYTRNGRIHAEFHPLRRTDDEEAGGGTRGTVTGRWSSSSPNLQNIPRRDPEIGPLLRRCFLPEEGEEWGKLDYSSQEPRLTTHFAFEAYSMREKLPRQWRHSFNGVEEMVRRYNENPHLSMHKEVAKEMGIDVKSDPRTYDMVKQLNLGIIYGMLGKKFCQTVGLPTKFITNRAGRQIEVAGDEGQAMMDKHGNMFPWIKGIQEFAQAVAEQRGYVTTVMGRRIRFEEYDAQGRRMFVYKALNGKVQGSAADQMKLAQVAFRKAGILPLVVVHDDANLSLPKGDAGRRKLAEAEEIMASVLKLAVPSVSEAKIGATWGDVA